jgi:hypothetical protein
LAWLANSHASLSESLQSQNGDWGKMVCLYNLRPVSWTKIGKAKLIANPTRATAKGIFIISSWEVRTICRPREVRVFCRVAGGEEDQGLEELWATRQLDASPIPVSIRNAMCCTCRLRPLIATPIRTYPSLHLADHRVTAKLQHFPKISSSANSQEEQTCLR